MTRLLATTRLQKTKHTPTQNPEMGYDDGAQLEFSAPKNLRRPTTELNRQLMTPHLIEAPWLKSRPPAVSEAMHHYYMAESYAASLSRNRALAELEQAIKLEPNNPKFYLLQAKVLLDHRE